MSKFQKCQNSKNGNVKLSIFTKKTFYNVRISKPISNVKILKGKISSINLSKSPKSKFNLSVPYMERYVPDAMETQMVYIYITNASFAS